MHYMDGNFYGMHFFWWIFWIVIVVWFLIAISRKRKGNETSLEILKRRYARGEITQEEYEKMRKNLE